jgi:hypothetical protein
MTAVSYDELVEADNRFTSNQDVENKGYYELWKSNSLANVSERAGSPSAQFAFFIYLSVILLFISLICVLIIYLDFVNKNFIGNSTTQSKLLFKSWWKYGKFALLITFLSAFIGVWFAASAVISVIAIKFPDYYVMAHGELSFNAKYPYGSYVIVANIIWVILLVAIIVGLGTRSRFATERELVKTSEQFNIQSKRNNKEIKDLWKLYFIKASNYIMDQDVNDFIDLLCILNIPYKYKHNITDEVLKDIGIINITHRLVYLSIIMESSTTNNVENVV